MSLRALYRTRFRTCMMTVCVLYLFVMFAFHFDVQDAEFNLRRKPQGLTPSPAAAVLTDRPSAASRSSPTPKHADDVMLPWDVELPDIDVRHVVIKNRSETRDCLGADNGAEFEFAEVIPRSLFVFSAYWDRRPNDFDNRHNGSYVRLIAVMRITGQKPAVSCRMRAPGGGVVAMPVHFYEMCENHGRPYGGYIVSCQLPPGATKQPCTVMVSGSNQQDDPYLIKVRPLSPREDRSRLAACVPPLYGNMSAKKLVEFIEISKRLGVHRSVFYDYKITDEIARVLEQYQEQGVVDVVPWPYPERLQQTSWYNGQLVAIQDCLYRNMETAEYLAFNDLDEYFVPRTHSDLNELMKAMFSSAQCAFQFNSAFFPPADSADGGVVFSSTRRTKKFSDIRTKCIVKPYLVFEKGIHHVSKPIWAHLEVTRMPEHVAFLHHYRSCVRDFAMDCRRYVEDEHMKKYAADVREILSRH